MAECGGRRTGFLKNLRRRIPALWFGAKFAFFMVFPLQVASVYLPVQIHMHHSTGAELWITLEAGTIGTYGWTFGEKFWPHRVDYIVNRLPSTVASDWGGRLGQWGFDTAFRWNWSELHETSTSLWLIGLVLWMVLSGIYFICYRFANRDSSN